MKTLDELKKLEKTPSADLWPPRYCDYIAYNDNEVSNITTRILQYCYNGKYYFHQMQHGEIIQCFEIALCERIAEHFYIFEYTPDDIHISVIVAKGDPYNADSLISVF